MVAGLPGTGIGGIYYILLAFIMPFWELVRLLRGQSSLKRWIMILKQVTNAAGILGGVYLTGWILACGLNAYRWLIATGSESHTAVQRATNVIPAASAYMAIITLGCVILFTHTLGIVLRYRGSLAQTGTGASPLPRTPRPVLPAASGRAAMP
jgi:hypothetical protein